MEKKLKKIIFNNWFISIFHLSILFLIVYNISYLNKIKECQSLNNILKSKFSDSDRQLKQLTNLEAYENSSLYQSRQMRERNYKFKDEQIIDISKVEDISSASENYIPKKIKEEETNPEKWLKVFTGNSLVKEEVSCN